MKKKAYISKGFRFIQEETNLKLLSDEFFLLVNEFENDLNDSVSNIDIITGAMRGLGSEFQLVYKFSNPTSEHQKLMISFIEYQELYSLEYFTE